MIFYKDS
ncbi:hypothetical protein E2C01_086655 [Portunus trituberculatus]|nr:hypothetical protein [Portunus trituberculatus]